MQVNRILDRFLQGEKVVWKPLGEVAKIEKGKQLNKKVLSETGDYPVINGGMSLSGYWHEYNYTADKIVISQGGASAGFVNWLQTPFFVGAHAFVVLPDETITLNRYVFHFLKMKQRDFMEKQYGAGIPTLAKSELVNLQIPIPPLHVQQKIADLLDQFSSLNTKLIAELAKEQALRAKQYTYYRDLLLNCEHPQNPFSGCDVQWKTLDKIAENLDAKRKPIKSTLRESGDIPYYGASGIVDYVKDYLFDGDYLLISEDGTNLLARSTPIAFSVSGKSWVNNHAHVLKFDTYAERKFVEYYFNSIDLKDYISGVAQPKLKKQNLNSIPIPVPPLEIQTQIAAILDKFDDLATQINEALPREIELRQKQYEYYREKLLDFHVSKQKAA
ncbi:restriction endonuclease subunit S [Kingella negevensis]|uniref:Putative type-1 restriction enzyme specificity protein MPN_089 n=1 Tax=Kingella negevensis TaxID=1522312 RepID=A0A238HFZ5_9NEIS|nr:restriction endonuclease subunit S [Kingella negevensis]MDK4681184.1 restriction endonuclease subunit S [Kingella negevensis]MDK4683382.1 restriction endonuclease subunit S [Kingella negevensis]MDK4685075.1 restriction endonuclease subunit S [Kingella negevensis]MDK4691484.1 restriction endonuclease subunit S [Kingella negevensis]MDK4693366.1 restriction endonuclease subunit S [Kingella negevensis]